MLLVFKALDLASCWFCGGDFLILMDFWCYLFIGVHSVHGCYRLQAGMHDGGRRLSFVREWS